MSHAQTLETWLVEEAEIRQRLEAGPGPGVARMDQIAGLSGLQMMQAMLRGEIPYAAIAKTLDFTLVKVSEGVAVFQGLQVQRTSTPWAPFTVAGTPHYSTPRWAVPYTP
jgi:hypothetical protein